MGDRESDIEEYLTKDGRVFLAPQYNIAFQGNPNLTSRCPDFVALDFGFKHIVIVEVTAAANIDALLEKVVERETWWYGPIRNTILQLGAVNSDWKIRFLGFIRETEVQRAEKRFAGQRDVAFFPIEEATFNWCYDTDRKNGLPGAAAMEAPYRVGDG